MNAVATQLVLEDLLADLRHARRTGDLGRLAFVAYCEVRRWARDVGETVLAERAADLVIASPFASRDVFLERADQLIQGLEQVRLAPGAPSSPPPPVSASSDSRGA